MRCNNYFENKTLILVEIQAIKRTLGVCILILILKSRLFLKITSNSPLLFLQVLTNLYFKHNYYIILLIFSFRYNL